MIHFFKNKKKLELSETDNQTEAASKPENAVQPEAVSELEETTQSEAISEPENAVQSEVASELESLPQPSGGGFFAKLSAGLSKTRDNLLGGVKQVIDSFKEIDQAFYEELEEALIMADLGVNSAVKIVEDLQQKVKAQNISDTNQILDLLKQELIERMTTDQQDYDFIEQKTVLLVIGVNGVGKTTTIGKLANLYKSKGKTVVLGAADTFRAAAIDQLKEWANRSGVPIIAQKENSDPAAVVYDAIASAKAKNADILIIDTAGRLHNKKNLMDELNKIYRVIEREYGSAHKEVLLVLDSTTGQNAVQQAKLFKETANITGVVLTKLDGTAKGGIIIPILDELKIPVKYVGVGEGINDLREFDAAQFIEALFEKSE